MTRKHRLHTLFDGIGLISLVVSIFALGGASWFAEASPQATMLLIFDYSFVIAVAAFLAARCVQITFVLVDTPDPKRLRIAASTAKLSESDEVVTPDIPRAA